jgi:two-component system, OmpR family, phosphate regulon response regulator OmpR
MNTDSPHILVVDDDTRLRGLLRKYLSDSGFRVTTAADAAEARVQLASPAFDLIVLDVMMPGESGLTFVKSIRPVNHVPVLLLTAMGAAEDRVRGFETGADDYLHKPFEPRELVLRIQSILRRMPREAGPAPEIRLGDCRFDLGREELSRGTEAVRLTTAEAGLLKVLAESAGSPVSREELSERCAIAGGLRAIDVQVTRLRRKIEPDPRLPRYLQTVRGRGYVLRPD